MIGIEAQGGRRHGGPCRETAMALAALSLGAAFSAPTGTIATAADPPRLVRVEWSRGPDLPQGFQDSAGAVLGSRLVTVCGFCGGYDDAKKPGRYPRGFLRKGWEIDLGRKDGVWRSLPDLPGVARQGLFGAATGGALYVWGGFNYDVPFCYGDGYRLSRHRNRWRWDRLPPLPYPLCGGAMSAVGSRIYLFAGADYDSKQFYTTSDRAGRQPRMGAQLWVFDTHTPGRGWERLAACPGTPRWVCAMATIRGHLYVIGGATGDVPGIGYCTVVDNWMYEIAADRWTRLADTPIATGNFPPGPSAFRSRYILLPGGYQYAKVANPDGTVRAPYGKPTKVGGRGDYYADLFVYDTKTDRFGTGDMLPINNNLATTVVHGDELLLLGGEADARELDGVYYGHHPDLFLRGKITVASPASAGTPVR